MSLTSPASTPKPAAAAARWPRIGGPRWWALLAFAAVLLLYRLWVVHHAGITLFFDEAQYWDWSRQMDWGYYSKPPVIAALIWLSTHLFGDSVLGVKAVTMALYPITALCLVGLARALWPTSGGVRTGVVAGALFLVMPMTGILGLSASTDAPLVLSWTLAMWALWRAQVTDRLGYWLLLGLVCGLGIMSKYTMAAFAVTAIWALWGIPGTRRGIARPGPWLAVAVALLVVSPNLWWNAQNDFPTLQHTAEITTQSQRDGGIGAALLFLAGQVVMLGPLAVFAGAWLYRRQRGQVHGPSLPPSQWTASTQATAARTAERGSPYYVAAVSSYRFLWAASIPLQVIAVVQSLNASAHVNWAAPSMISFTLLIASRLSPPLLALAAPRPNRWLVAVLATNLVLTAIAVHLRDVAGQQLPSRWDLMVRMRGWDQAFEQLRPALQDPVVQGLPVLTDQRLTIAQAAYHWREPRPTLYMWNPQDARNNHYLLNHSFPNQVGQDVLLLTKDEAPSEITERFAITREMGVASVPVGPDRTLTLRLYFLRGFLGYTPRPELQEATPMHTPVGHD